MTGRPPKPRAVGSGLPCSARKTVARSPRCPTSLRLLAADRSVIAAMRPSLAQLWLLYGPGGFVHRTSTSWCKPRSRKKDRAHGTAGLPDARRDQARSVLTRLAGALLVRPARGGAAENPGTSAGPAGGKRAGPA